MWPFSKKGIKPIAEDGHTMQCRSAKHSNPHLRERACDCKPRPAPTQPRNEDSGPDLLTTIVAAEVAGELLSGSVDPAPAPTPDPPDFGGFGGGDSGGGGASGGW